VAQAIAARSSPLQRTTVHRPGRGRDFLRRLSKNPGAIIGLIIILILILGAILAPVITTYEPNIINPRHRLQPPGREHWLGADPFGRDLYTRLVYGARVSLPIGLIAVSISASVGVVLGLISGYYGRIIDGVIMRIIDIMLAFPGILLALVVVAILGPNLQNVMIAVGIGGIPRYTRLVRGSVLSSRELVYVEAARVVGVPDRTILFRHILPNVIGPAVVLSTISVGSAILSAAGLSFLGLGAQPPTAEWGSMLADGRQFLRTDPWVTTVPGVAIMVTVLSVNLFGDGLRDILDPRLRT
jgi:peptide/nickel transport system permease protein